jgi:hypothetical protein
MSEKTEIKVTGTPSQLEYTELISAPGIFDGLYAMITGKEAPEANKVTAVELHQGFMDAIKKAAGEAFVESFESMTADDEEEPFINE